MATTPADPAADQVFAAVARLVLTMHPGDEEGRMLRSSGLRTGGRFYAFATTADVVVKLPASRVHQLIEAGEGAPCSPRPGRPMREWVRLPSPNEKTCLAYLLEARDFVSSA